MATFRWTPSPTAEAVTQYVIEKSTDNGLTFTEVETIENDTTNAAVFDASLHKFYWVDPTPVDGEIVRMAAENADGLGPYAYTYGPPARLPTCNVFGVLLDGIRGAPLYGTVVSLRVVEAPPAANAQVPGITPRAVGVAKSDIRVQSDAHGRWNIDVYRGAVVELAIPDLGFALTFRVPERAVLNYLDAGQYRSRGTRHRSGGVGGGFDGA